MTTSEFFKKLLASQALSKEQLDGLNAHEAEIEKYLHEKFGNVPTIRDAGSRAKDTMIAESYDLDMICYFPHEENSLKDIHDDVQKALATKYTVEAKTTAIRIKAVNNDETGTDYHIDVVPGRFVDGNDGDAFLHVTYGEQKWIKTNVDVHVAYIKDSGCQNVIKILKLWRSRNDVPLKTFALDIITIETLRGKQYKDDLPKATREILTRIRDEIKTIRLEDPANSGNVISEGISSGDKDIAASKASEAIKLLDDNKNNELFAWQKIFDEETSAGSWSGPTVISKPPKPHCEIPSENLFSN